MSGKGQKSVAKSAGALVPVSRRTDLFRPASVDLHVKPARSDFLTQLSHQYETREQAGVRRACARDCAAKSYDSSSVPAAPRHLVWA